MLEDEVEDLFDDDEDDDLLLGVEDEICEECGEDIDDCICEDEDEE
jgi:hypothetical protein